MKKKVAYDNTDKKFKVFVVEDSEIYRELLSKFIEDLDEHKVYREDKKYEIESFSTGEECVVALHKKPDIVVLDYYLNQYSNSPDCMDGLRTLQQIKKFSPDTHVILVSSQGDFKVTSQFYKHGASDYISKEPGIRERLQKSIIQTMRIIEEKESQADA